MSRVGSPSHTPPPHFDTKTPPAVPAEQGLILSNRPSFPGIISAVAEGTLSALRVDVAAGKRRHHSGRTPKGLTWEAPPPRFLRPSRLTDGAIPRKMLPGRCQRRSSGSGVAYAQGRQQNHDVHALAPA